MSKGLTKMKEFTPFKVNQNYPRELRPTEKSSGELQIYLNKGCVTLEEEQVIERCRKCGKKKEYIKQDPSFILVKGQDTQTPPLENVLNNMQSKIESTRAITDISVIRDIPWISVVINEVTTCDTLPQTLLHRTNVSEDERWIQKQEQLSDISSLNCESQTLTIQELQSENSKEIAVPGKSSTLGSILSFAILASLSLFSLLELEKLNPFVSYANGTFMVFAIYSLMGIWASYVESKEDHHQIPGAYVKALVSQIATAVPFLAVEVWLEFFKYDMIHQYAGHIYAGACAIPLFLYPVAGFSGVKRMLSVMVALGLGVLTALFLLQDNHVGLAAIVAYSVAFLCQGDESERINSRKQMFMNICNCVFLCFTLVTLEELYTKPILDNNMTRLNIR